MIALEDGVGKGSIRSVPDFDVFSALQKCSEYLKEFGGHKYAAGLTIDEDKIPEFKEAFKKSVLESITHDALIPKLNIDGILTLDQITPNFYNILKNFAPFGPQNSRPVFVAQGTDVVGRPIIVGKNHLKFSVRQNNAIMPAIGFNLGGHIDRLMTERTGINVAFVVDENTWRGKTTLQLQVKDIR
jgi:single-stranded-DNA-specific exonuclease